MLFSASFKGRLLALKLGNIESKMKPSIRSSIVALFTSAGLLAGCNSEAEVNINVSQKVTNNKTFKSLVHRVNDDVAVNIVSLDGKNTSENLAFKCSNKAGLEAAYQRAASETKALDDLAENHKKNLSRDILNKPEEFQKILKDLEGRTFAHGKVDAIKDAGTICGFTLPDILAQIPRVN